MQTIELYLQDVTLDGWPVYSPSPAWIRPLTVLVSLAAAFLLLVVFDCM